MTKHWVIEKSEALLEAFPHVYREVRETAELNKKTAAERSHLSPQMVGYFEEAEKEPSLLSFFKLALGVGMRPSELLARLEERAGLDAVPPVRPTPHH